MYIVEKKYVATMSETCPLLKKICKTMSQTCCNYVRNMYIINIKNMSEACCNNVRIKYIITKNMS